MSPLNGLKLSPGGISPQSSVRETESAIIIDYVILIGSVAGILSTISGLPQLIKIIRIRETKDLSLASIVIGITGSTFWLIYGVCIWPLPLIGSNTIGLSVNFAILGYKIKYH